jgi:excisionase family DNA binding protein
MTGPEAWLSVEEIARHLNVSKETIYRWLEKEKIPAHRMGKLWRFKPSEVDEWITKGGAEESRSLKPKSKSRKGN